MNRRLLLERLLGLGAGMLLAPWARPLAAARPPSLTPSAAGTYDLTVSAAPVVLDERAGNAVLINQQLPAPLLRWREGQRVRIAVRNLLAADTSIHWHGILLPPDMDGVPGVSFPGIQAGSTFTYEFPLLQAGTYWYHSHSGLQEQLGHYGPLVIDPAGPDPVAYDREHIIVLSDWTFEDPHRVFKRLKMVEGAYNKQKNTLADFGADVRSKGWRSAWSERRRWGAMRMDPTDIADVTATTYTYLINGHTNLDHWTGLFQPGERVRLRIINASAMSIFNVRIPGLPMTVVQADGLNVQPVSTDELQIGTAETYDVVVQPMAAKAYAVVAESNDRSGFVHGSLAPRAGLRAAPPPLRKRPTLTMKDMGMAHDADGRHGHHHHHEQIAHDHKTGPGVVGLAMNPVNRLAERPLGLEDEPHRVLVYTDLKSLEPNPDTRRPEREIELHLTSNMQRYMWSFDGVKFSEVESPIVFHEGERLRVVLVNDTMMPHPIHLHGMFFELVTEAGPHKPRKHTVVVKPGERMAFEVTPEPLGEWAFHCHLLYHMHAGMMRVVSVRPPQDPPA